MPTTYEAKLTGDHLEWSGEAPALGTGNSSVKVLVTVLEDQQTLTTEELRRRRVEAIERLAAMGGIRSISDPSEWQRETRKDRPLPGRED